jgi:hypothetical protein
MVEYQKTHLSPTEIRIIIEKYPESEIKQNYDAIVQNWDKKKSSELYKNRLILGKEIYKVVNCISLLYALSVEFIDDPNSDPGDLYRINPCCSVNLSYNYNKKILRVNTIDANIIPTFTVYITEDSKKIFEAIAFYFTPINMEFYMQIEEAIIFKMATIKFNNEMKTEEELGFNS